jgi:hypothetical protein
MPRTQSAGRGVVSGEFSPHSASRRGWWRLVHCRIKNSRSGAGVGRRAILMVCFGSALATADSYLTPWKSLAIPNCRAPAPWSCEVKRNLTGRLSPHWDSSLLLSAGGEDLQLQIARAAWTKMRRESAHSQVLLPAALSGIGPLGKQSQRAPSDRYSDFLMTIVKKLLLSAHPWRDKPTPRCRNNPGAAGCD